MHRLATIITVLTAVALALARCDLPSEPTLDDAVRDLARRKGRLVRIQETPSYYDGTTTIHDVTLESSTGLVVDARVRRAIDATAATPKPAAVIIGGAHTGRGSVNLVQNDNPYVSLGMNYQDVIQYEYDADKILEQKDLVREAVRNIPAMVSLLVDYVDSLDYVDHDRIVMIGVSFGGFFTPRTAAVDQRIRNIALLYTGADLTMLATQGARRGVPDAIATLGGDLALLGWQDMDPLHWIDDVAPRHILMVNGREDEQILNDGARELFARAHEPKEFIWLPTGHLSPEDTTLIQELVDTAMARLPVLKP